MLDNLNNYRVILASKSPRRQELLEGLGIDFQVKTLSDVNEDFPQGTPVLETAKYVASKKAEAYMPYLLETDLIITADTVVIIGDEVLGKPADREEAISMLKQLSGATHKVLTGVCVQTKEQRVLFDACTEVRFSTLDDAEIAYYVDTFKPFDKAGAYGVQEWIGYIGVEYMSGSYYNIMGLPIQKLYATLKEM